MSYTDNVDRIKRELRDIGAGRFVEARLAALDVSELVNDIGAADEDRGDA